MNEQAFNQVSNDIAALVPKNVKLTTIDPAILALIIQVIMEVLKYVMEHYKLCNFSEAEIAKNSRKPNPIFKMLLNRKVRQSCQACNVDELYEVAIRKSFIEYGKTVSDETVKSLVG